MEVIGRVESGTETESNAGRLYGYRRSKMSGTNFPAVAEDVLSGFLLLANPKYLHPCRQYHGCMDDIQEVLVSRGQVSGATAEGWLFTWLRKV